MNILDKLRGKANLPSRAYDNVLSQGLSKKPGGLPPGQYKKLWGKGQMDFTQASQSIYLDPEAVVEAQRYSQSMILENQDKKQIQKETNRNIVLTYKGFHPAKIPHPMLTHFIA